MADSYFSIDSCYFTLVPQALGSYRAGSVRFRAFMLSKCFKRIKTNCLNGCILLFVPLRSNKLKPVELQSCVLSFSFGVPACVFETLLDRTNPIRIFPTNTAENQERRTTESEPLEHPFPWAAFDATHISLGLLEADTLRLRREITGLLNIKQNMFSVVFVFREILNSVAILAQAVFAQASDCTLWVGS